MLTDFIQETDVRKKLNELFPKPKLVKPDFAFPSSIPYNARLLGNAIEYYIHLKYDFLNKTGDNHTIINELIENFFPLIGNHFNNYKNPYRCFLKHMHNYHWFTTVKYYIDGKFETNEYSFKNDGKTDRINLMDIFLGVVGAFDELKKFHKNGKETNKFIESILILAKILPGFRMHSMGNEPLNVSRNDKITFQRLIKLLPKNLFKKRKDFKRYPAIGYGYILGRPDFLIDNELLEIKTSKDFFCRSDFNQVLMYYLIYKMQRKMYKRQGVMIEKVSILYPLYKSKIELNLNEVINRKNYSAFLKFFETKKNSFDHLFPKNSRLRENN
ncbi:MAG: hypothetical protein ACHQNT_10265 [Bacteroidia bacterium]